MHSDDETLLSSALRRLPEVAPPADLWSRIERDVAAPPATAGIPRRLLWRDAGSLAAAAALVAIVVAGLARMTLLPDGTAQPSIAALLAESERLERDLADIDYQRPLISGVTLAAIVTLEDQLALIDGVLAGGGAPAEAADARLALLDARVQVLGALVEVRRAQAEPTVF